MDIEKILREYPYFAEEIQKLNEELNQTLKLKLQTQDTLKAQNIDGMPHSTGISDITYKAVEKSIDEHEKHMLYLTNKISEIYRKKKFIEELLPKLTMEEYRVIDLYYFKGYRLRRVAYMMHYSKSSCWRLKCSALEKLGQSGTNNMVL